jgi:hypothetical protein
VAVPAAVAYAAVTVIALGAERLDVKLAFVVPWPPRSRRLAHGREGRWPREDEQRHALGGEAGGEAGPREGDVGKRLIWFDAASR